VAAAAGKNAGGKAGGGPSISITALPRPANGAAPGAGNKAGTSKDGKPTFIICEICDGYVKDLEQLRNHMSFIHKVKIHPKMIYNRPPLNCQKCQHRFFTDQGLERHLLGTHGLVTSSMQEAANKSKDAGRCPICGKVFQWKLLNHVAREHKMTLKPAHLSYKCTVCTATFNMYRLFENHVYSAHSVVNKTKDSGAGKATANGGKDSGSSSTGGLKINDEITIIPQSSSGAGKSAAAKKGKDSITSSVSKEITITKVGSAGVARGSPARTINPIKAGSSVEVISLDDPKPSTSKRSAADMAASTSKRQRLA